MQEFNSNSNSQKRINDTTNNRTKVESVATGSIKNNKARQAARMFFGSDLRTAAKDTFVNVAIPSIKKGISDFIKNGIDALIYGGVRYSGDRRYDDVSYQKYWKAANYSTAQQPRRAQTSDAFIELDNIDFKSKQDAIDVLDSLQDRLSRYSIVSVDEYYDLAGLSAQCPISWNQYGWTDLSTAVIQLGIDGGWYIKLPKPRPIK
jgi:hypothetical protein